MFVIMLSLCVYLLAFSVQYSVAVFDNGKVLQFLVTYLKRVFVQVSHSFAKNIHNNQAPSKEKVRENDT